MFKYTHTQQPLSAAAIAAWFDWLYAFAASAARKRIQKAVFPTS